MLINLFALTYMQFKMREPQMCNIVCKLKLDAKTAKEFKEKIDDEYYEMLNCDMIFDCE